jgi:hypothetical protein
MPAGCATPALIYNPPGTTRRDCFRGRDGRFLTLSIQQAALGGRDAKDGRDDEASAQAIDSSGASSDMCRTRDLTAPAGAGANRVAGRGAASRGDAASHNVLEVRFSTTCQGRPGGIGGGVGSVAS